MPHVLGDVVVMSPPYGVDLCYLAPLGALIFLLMLVLLDANFWRRIGIRTYILKTLSSWAQERAYQDIILQTNGRNICRH